jgi:orotate phosphoribosyltransferase
VETVAQILDLPYGKLYEHEDAAGEFLIRRETPRGKVLIVDGAVRTGRTIQRVASYLSGQGLKVDDAVVVMVRPEGEKLKALKARLSDTGVSLHGIITARELINHLHKLGELTAEKVNEIMMDEDFN